MAAGATHCFDSLPEVQAWLVKHVGSHDA